MRAATATRTAGVLRRTVVELVPLSPLGLWPRKFVKNVRRGAANLRGQEMRRHWLLRWRKPPANGGGRQSSGTRSNRPNQGVWQRGRSGQGVRGFFGVLGTRQMAWACTGRLGCATSTRVRPGCACGACVFDSRKKKVARAHGQWLEARWIRRGSGASDPAVYRFAGIGLRRRELGRGVGWLASGAGG